MLFEEVLDITVDGQHKRVSILCWDILLSVGRHILVLCVLYAHQTARRTGKHIVVLSFQTISAIVVAADIAEYCGQERTLLVIAFGIRLGIYARATRFFQRGI